MFKSSSELSEKCCCQYYEDEKIIADAGCADDIAAVATLPDHWIPRHSGPVLATYLKEREFNHEKVNQDISDKSSDMNQRIDAKIRDLAEILLTHIKQNQIDIECVVEKCNTGEGPLSVEARNEAFKKVSQLYSERLEEIAAFRRDATTVERSRADGIRKIMRDQFQRLISVGHLPPKDLLHDFDDRMYEVNQQLLSNFRAYHELEAQLHAEADESVINARSDLNQLCLGITMASRRHCPRPKTTEERKLERSSISNSERRRPSSNPSILKCPEIEECISCLLDVYRKAVLIVFSGFSDKLSDLHNSLIIYNADHTGVDCESSQLKATIDRVLSRLSSKFQKKIPSKELAEITLADALNMEKTLCSLGNHLRDTYTILHDAGHLWDPHMMRSALAQKLTMAAVEDIITYNDTIEEANEVSFNIALEQLRNTSDADKLQNQFEALAIMLDRTAELYLQHCEIEIGRFEEYMNFPPLMANILLAECACFLEAHPRVQKNNSAPTVIGEETPKRDIYRRSPVPRALLQTELQIIALENWRNGFLEAFECNICVVSEELARQARQWVDERSAALQMRYSVKMISHSIRVERLKAAQEARLSELRYHEARLNSHLDAIYALVDTLPEQASKFLSLDAPELYPLCDWVQHIQDDLDRVMAIEDIDPEVKRLKMTSYVPRLPKYRQLYEDSLEEAIEVRKKDIEQNLQEARISNCRFIEQIKLFSECGRYSGAEAVKVSAALLKAADMLEVCSRRTIDLLHNRRTQLLALADHTIVPLQKIIEEHLKVTAKISKSHEKKKPAGKKK